MQKSGLTEIIPLTWTSALWGQYPVFSHPEFPRGGHPWGWVPAVVVDLMAGIQFPSGDGLMAATSFVP